MKFGVALTMQLALLATFEGFSRPTMAFTSTVSLPQPQTQFALANAAAAAVRPFSSSTKIYRAPSKWDDLVDEDDDDEPVNIPATADMKYVPRNVVKQHQNFVALREAAGPEMTFDVYIPEPESDGVFWFAGKVASISDVSVEQAVARQWPLIVMHGANLRPVELYPHRADLEIWIAPGDSELEVAYNRPELLFKKMTPDVEGAKEIKSSAIGFQGEIYDKGQGMGFRTWRTEDGKPSKPEIQTPSPEVQPAAVKAEAGDAEQFSDEKFRAPTDAELEKLQAALQDKDMDISQLYAEQQEREGKSDE